MLRVILQCIWRHQSRFNLKSKKNLLIERYKEHLEKNIRVLEDRVLEEREYNGKGDARNTRKFKSDSLGFII